MFYPQAKGIQQSSRNILLKAAAYDTVRKRDIYPLQETKKKHMEILDKNKARPENYESNITTRNTPDSTSGIYLATAKVPQHSMVNDNTRENKEAKNETENKTAA